MRLTFFFSFPSIVSLRLTRSQYYRWPVMVYKLRHFKASLFRTFKLLRFTETFWNWAFNLLENLLRMTKNFCEFSKIFKREKLKVIQIKQPETKSRQNRKTWALGNQLRWCLGIYLCKAWWNSGAPRCFLGLMFHQDRKSVPPSTLHSIPIAQKVLVPVHQPPSICSTPCQNPLGPPTSPLDLSMKSSN